MLYGNPPFELIVPVKRRISFLYCEYGQVLREGNSLIFRQSGIDYDLPVANLAVLMLGTGTSITQPAANEISRWGCTISFVKGDAIGLTTNFQSTVNSSKLIIKQAEITSSIAARTQTARKLYAMRWKEDIIPKSYGIRKMMTFEGRRMKDVYRSNALKYGYDFQRVQNFDSSDPINQNITVLYSMLYNLSNAFIVSMGLSPALGIIHHGNARSFVFDIADLYKEDAVDLAFKYAHEGIFGNDIRAPFRNYLKDTMLRERIVDDILECLNIDESDFENTESGEDISYLWGKDEIIENDGYGI